MIPTMLLLGLILGRAWALPVGSVAWSALLLSGRIIGWTGVPPAAALACGNVAAGALFHRAARRPLRHLGTVR